MLSVVSFVFFDVLILLEFFYDDAPSPLVENTKTQSVASFVLYRLISIGSYYVDVFYITKS